VRALKSTGHPALSRIHETVVYAHLTINSLTALVLGEESEMIGIEDMIQRYASNGLSEPRLPVKPLPEERVVLLTGSTGNLGAELLLRLIQNTNIKTIYAFNRPSSRNVHERHAEKFKDRGVDPTMLMSKKVIYLVGDVSQHEFGLNTEDYENVSVPISPHMMTKPLVYR
jgi:FlaA1/EpsC-like NDP-sugar epimerase